MLILLLLPSWSIASSPVEISSSPGEIASSPGGITSSPGGIASSPGGIASSPGGDASPRRHLLGKARCLDKQIQYIFSLPSWGIEPQLDNTDAGTRRPQVRTRCPQFRVSILCRPYCIKQISQSPNRLTLAYLFYT